MTPDEYTIKETFLDVGQGHELYIQEWGNPKAKIPILFLHGGPGGGCKDRHKGVFNPENQRVIFFDQRGSGKSLPTGSLTHNTTADLVEDIEKIAIKLNLNKFVISGGSWGSCLAFAYALKYPARIKSMVLLGIYTGTQSETEHITKGRFCTFFPDVWQRYLSQTPTKYLDDPTAYHAKRILGKDAATAKKSAYIFNELDSSLMKLDDRHMPENYDEFDPTTTKIEMYYFVNNCFLPDRYVLDNAHKLTMPIWLVQGRYDVVCPPFTAYDLSRQIPNCQLIWTISGHYSEHETWNIARTILMQLST